MKSKPEKEHEVYIIGQKKSVKTRIYVICICAFVSLVLIFVCIFFFPKSQQESAVVEHLSGIEVLPRDASAPQFDEKYEFSEFFVWVSKNIKYPKGMETAACSVEASFVITKEGKLDRIKVETKPGQEAFGYEVERVLKACPRWTPGKLADGTPIDINYTLPFKFNKVKRFN